MNTVYIVESIGFFQIVAETGPWSLPDTMNINDDWSTGSCMDENFANTKEIFPVKTIKCGHRNK